MTHIGNEPAIHAPIGQEAQLRGDLPAIADAPPLAPLPEGGEGQPGLSPGSGKTADGQDLQRQDNEAHALSGQDMKAQVSLYRRFKDQQEGSPLRQGFHEQGSDVPPDAPLRQGVMLSQRMR